jgi:hypothetical protein
MVFGEQPITDVLACVRTEETSGATADGTETEIVAFERDKRSFCRIISEPVAATPTASVFEIENVLTGLAGKDLHRTVTS